MEREPQQHLLQHDLVYKYTCACNKVYIGETLRRLAIRVSEHQSPESPLSEHVQTCEESIRLANAENTPSEPEPTHHYMLRSQTQTPRPPPKPIVPRVDSERFSIVARHLRGKEARKRFETVYIQFYNKRAQTVNVCEKSRTLAVF